MIKILDNSVFGAECPECGTAFSYEREDVAHGEVICPLCGEHIQVDIPATDKTHTCDRCGREFAYSPAAPVTGVGGMKYVHCPYCHEENIVDENRAVPPTFPKTFFHFRNGAKLSDDQIQEYVNECLDYLNKHRDEDFAYAATGDTFVVALRWEDQTQIVVGKDYWEDALFPEGD